MRYRIAYVKEELRYVVFDGKEELLSNEGKVFVDVVESHCEPAVSTPEYNKYVLEVEVS